MHPLCLTLIQRPDLLVDHLSAYADLFKQEANHSGNMLLSRLLLWFIAVMSVLISIVLSGMALMLGVLQNQFHWILIAVPGIMALCAVIAVTWAKQSAFTRHFELIKSQLLKDAEALRIAAIKAA